MNKLLQYISIFGALYYLISPFYKILEINCWQEMFCNLFLMVLVPAIAFGYIKLKYNCFKFSYKILSISIDQLKVLSHIHSYNGCYYTCYRNTTNGSSDWAIITSLLDKGYLNCVTYSLNNCVVQLSDTTSSFMKDFILIRVVSGGGTVLLNKCFNMKDCDEYLRKIPSELQLKFDGLVPHHTVTVVYYPSNKIYKEYAQ